MEGEANATGLGMFKGTEALIEITAKTLENTGKGLANPENIPRAAADALFDAAVAVSRVVPHSEGYAVTIQCGSLGCVVTAFPK